jgi:hypothetical protein
MCVTQIEVNDFERYNDTEGYLPAFFDDIDNRRLMYSMSDGILIDRDRCPHLLSFEVPNELIESYDSFVNYIKRNIDFGMYTFGFANVTKIKNYGDDWLPLVAYHQVFIYGYDDAERVFHFADFLVGGKYMFSTCSYDEIEEAYKHIKDFPLPEQKSMTSIKYISEPAFGAFEFDYSYIKQKVADYIDPSKEKAQNFEKYTNGYVKNRDWHTHIFLGHNVYDFLIQFLEIEQALGLPRFDHKPYHALFDHKQMMIQRVQYLVQKGYLPDNKLSLLNNYAKVEKNAKTVRDLIVKYNFRKEESQINRAIALLSATREYELPILTEIFDIKD